MFYRLACLLAILGLALSPSGAGAQAPRGHACDYGVTGTAASGSAVTVTLPSVSGQTHYICSIEIRQYAAGALTGGATPVIVTSTNLPGTPAWTFQTALAIGLSEAQISSYPNWLKALAQSTATTIVAPATTSVIWRVTVAYSVAP